ncbi:hypothetical protein [Psychroserpens sp. SPM9]|uniref:hypothetical protein n=1 Tax=Psychroserpens sp. SPM9 TaxID=2975598 RepID=UPI0021A513FD|nr:hypothetical protein [Psychroserpens sp. SPM9]MDG5490628.1 hypothetical protein [Psychroserpens sp. SPM9]
MSMPTNVLIVEREPLITYSIQEALHRISESQSGVNYNTTSVSNYESVRSKIKSLKHLNLVFLNIDMFLTGGEKSKLIIDMISILKKTSPKVQVLTLTSYRNNYMILEIIKTINPEGVLLKRDIDFEDLIHAIKNVINNIPFYSKTILMLLRSRMTCHISLDEKDQLILYHLSKGAKTKDLSNLVFLSKSAIESRKRNLKILFNVEKKNDCYLLDQARIKGFI